MIISPLLRCEFIKDLCTLLALHFIHSLSHSLPLSLFHTPFICFIFHSLNGWNPLIKSLPLLLDSAQLSKNIIKCKRQQRWCTRATHSLFGCTRFHLAIRLARIVATSRDHSIRLFFSRLFSLYFYVLMLLSSSFLQLLLLLMRFFHNFSMKLHKHFWSF